MASLGAKLVKTDFFEKSQLKTDECCMTLILAYGICFTSLSCASVATVSSAAGCCFLGLLLVLEHFLFLLLTQTVSSLVAYFPVSGGICVSSYLGQQQM